VRVHHTQARQVSIAERRKPDPRGQPGYLRVDTVHQGNHDGQAGLYHIDAVDRVTQRQVVGCVETISERHLIPVLRAMLHQFPFLILGFRCDNGSEFYQSHCRPVAGKTADRIHQVAGLPAPTTRWWKARTVRSYVSISVTERSPPSMLGTGILETSACQLTSTGLEDASGQAFQKFYTAHLNPYLNYHRPCGFATIRILPRGKRQRRYPVEDYRTPYEKLVSLPSWEQHLKPGITPPLLQQQALRMSDMEAAQQMQKAKLALLVKARPK